MEYLSQKGVEFTEKNVSRNPEAVQELMSLGGALTAAHLDRRQTA